MLISRLMDSAGLAAVRRLIRRGGFTLIELLVVIAIVATLAGLLLSGLPLEMAAVVKDNSDIVRRRWNRDHEPH